MKLKLPKLFKSSVFWLGLILALGLWLRLYQIDQKIWLYSGLDSARDVLVAKHIVNYSETILKGPYVNGGHYWLQNSPVYYYFLAGLWFFTRSIIGITIAWSIVLASGIGLSFWAGKLTRDTPTGLIAALIYAIHPELILQASQIFQPHLLPLFSLLSYIWLLKAWQQKSGLYLVAGTSAILFPIHLHYSIGLVIPVFGLAIVYLISRMIKDRWKNWQRLLFLLVLTVSSIFLSWVNLTYKFEPFDQFEIFSLNQDNQILPLTQKLGIIFQTLEQLCLGFISDQTRSLIWLTAAILTWLTQAQLNRRLLSLWHWLLTGILLTVSLALCFNGVILTNYFLGLMPFFIIFWAGSLRSLWQFNWQLGLVSLGLIFSWAYQQDLRSLAKTDPELSFAAHFQAGSQAIYADYQALNFKTYLQPSFAVAALSTSIPQIRYDAWLASVYWLYLENLFNQKLVKLSDSGVNHLPLQAEPEYIYFSCHHYYKPGGDQEFCYKPFSKARNNIDAGQIIFSDEVQTIWRFNVLPGAEALPWARNY